MWFFRKKKKPLDPDERSKMITELAKSPNGTGQVILTQLVKGCQKRLAVLSGKGGGK